MRCPYCNQPDTKVLETRETGEDITRRRRECLKCSKRFTTYEQVEMVHLSIIKRDGRTEQFDRQKLLNGLLRACEKRPISREQLEDIAREIEIMLRNHKTTEVKSTHIGELALRRLKKLDTVAYIRFASVYRDFSDLESFAEELRNLAIKKKENKVKIE